jgi:hypothetical protein
MLGSIIFSSVYRGATFSVGNFTYALLNGQSVSRVTYPDFSNIWPSGVYGAGDVDTPAHLPNLNNIYLRGVDFGRNADPDSATRTALSGVIPSGNFCGSYQAGGLKSHTHASGTQGPPIAAVPGGGGEGGRTTATYTIVSSGTVVADPRTAGTAMEFGKAGENFDVAHTRAYYYIRIL